MSLLALAVWFALPVGLRAQTERAADVRVVEPTIPAGARGALSAAPAPISLTAAPLGAAPALSAGPATRAAAPFLPSASAAAAPAPAAVHAAAAAAADQPSAAPAAAAPAAPAEEEEGLAAATSKSGAPNARGQLDLGAGARSGAALDSGRLTFDGGAAAADETAVAAGPLSEGRRLSRASSPAPAAAPSIPLQRRAGEAVELGAYAAGMQLLTGLAFLWFGAHASFPFAAGTVWMLFGAELIAQLGKLRGVIVGGWQASHDQKMRTDYGTGRLRDIRGRKYGEDRYDEFAPGPVSPRERAALDASAFLLGLPWVAPAGARAVAAYVVGAAAAYGARRLWSRLRPAPAPVAKTPDFEYDR